MNTTQLKARTTLASKILRTARKLTTKYNERSKLGEQLQYGAFGSLAKAEGFEESLVALEAEGVIRVGRPVGHPPFICAVRPAAHSPVFHAEQVGGVWHHDRRWLGQSIRPNWRHN